MIHFLQVHLLGSSVASFLVLVICVVLYRRYTCHKCKKIGRLCYEPIPLGDYYSIGVEGEYRHCSACGYREFRTEEHLGVVGVKRSEWTPI